MKAYRAARKGRPATYIQVDPQVARWRKYRKHRMQPVTRQGQKYDLAATPKDLYNAPECPRIDSEGDDKGVAATIVLNPFKIDS